MVDRRKTVRRLFVAGFAALALIVGVVAIPTFGIGRQGNLPGIYDSSKTAAAETAPDVDPESLPHDHNNPATKNDVSRGGEVGKSVADPTNSAERAIATAYVAQARRTPDPPLTSVRPVQKRLKFPQDRYAMANGCYRMAGKPTYFKATDLGTYLLYTKRRKFRTADGLADAAGADTVWAATATSGKKRPRFTFTRGGTTLKIKGRTSFRLLLTKGCAAFPEAGIDIGGRPHAGVTKFQEVRGYVDAHTHGMAFEFLGGMAHCGRPWDPFGVSVALTDCVDHTVTGGYGGILETFLSGEPSHDPVGWPTFKDWPAPHSLTHEGTYYRWLERAWRGGQRIFVNLLVENNQLCMIYPLKKNSCDATSPSCSPVKYCCPARRRTRRRGWRSTRPRFSSGATTSRSAPASVVTAAGSAASTTARSTSHTAWTTSAALRPNDRPRAQGAPGSRPHRPPTPSGRPSWVRWASSA